MAPKYELDMYESHDIERINTLIKKLNPFDTTEKVRLDYLKKLRSHISGSTVHTKYNRKLQHQDGELFSRYYADGDYNFQQMDSVMRDDLMSPYYIQLDLNLAHPNILNQLCISFGLDCKELSEYCANRKEIIEQYDIDKQFINKLCNTDVFKVKKQLPEIKDISFFENIHKAIYFSLVPILKHNYPKIYEASVKNKKEKKKTDYNIDGSFIANLLMTLECDFINICRKYLKDEGYSVDAIIHDALVVKKDKKINQELLDKLHCMIKNSKFRNLDIQFEMNFKIQVPEQYPLFLEVLNRVDKNEEKKEKEKSDVLENIICESLFKIYSKNIKVCDDILWLKDFDYVWKNDKEVVKHIVFYWIGKNYNNTAISKYNNIYNIFKSNCKDIFQDNNFIDKFYSSTKGIICFINGYITVFNKKFTKWSDPDSDPEIYTDRMIPYNYEPSSENARKWVFDNVLNPIFNDDKELMNEYLTYTSNALAGLFEKWFLCSDGERDSGKGVLTTISKVSFKNYCEEFSTNNLLDKKNFEAEERNTWFDYFTKNRLMFGNESKAGHGSKFNSEMIKKLTGGDGLIMKLMKENQKAVRNRSNMIIFQNDIPGFSNNDVFMNMLYFRFPCYFAFEARSIEYAVFKQANNNIKSQIENDDSVKCAFVDIVCKHYTPGFQYPLMTKLKKEYLSIDDSINDEAILDNLFDFTNNKEDKLHTNTIIDLLHDSGLDLSACKLKKRLEKKGCIYNESTRINGVKKRGYYCICLKRIENGED